ncbi:MAG: hypothetical protein AVO34_01940 [Firmicutes bacterium ML8_F2]|jgi:16S rRNA (cytosine1402-N4)-methyltransferase|nr:MAG: hypothetical protein AVO34_01940 [Firmicutes bacterium ML8_F2]
MEHQPVLLKEVLKYLDPQSGENFIDCTFGFGGHALAILKKVKPTGKVLGIDSDKKALAQTKTKNKNLILTQGNFADLKRIVEEQKFQPVNGILFDLGISSWQIDKSQKGFSFQKDEPLDMRFDQGKNDLTAEQIVNYWEESELEKIFREYGEERFSKKIARNICLVRQNRNIKTTSHLVEVIKQAIPGKFQHGRTPHSRTSSLRGRHFATRIFQALRIAVNDELNNLELALNQSLGILEANGRLAVISFHSLEDRIVKNSFREQAKENNLKILTKKPVQPTEQEIEYNKRSRSAKLRVVVKI